MDSDDKKISVMRTLSFRVRTCSSAVLFLCKLFRLQFCDLMPHSYGLCVHVRACIKATILYRMAGNFRGSQFSRFLRLTGDPRKLNPRNKKPKRTRARAITGGVAIVVHAAAQLD